MNKLLRLSSWSLLGRIMGAGFSFLFTFLIARLYGASILGEFTLFLIILQLSSIISRLGLDTFLLKTTAICLIENRMNRLFNYFVKGRNLVFVSSFLMFIILLLLSKIISAHMFSDKDIFCNVIIIGMSLFVVNFLFINSDKIRATDNIFFEILYKTCIPYFLSSVIITLSFYKLNLQFSQDSLNFPLIVYFISTGISGIICFLHLHKLITFPSFDSVKYLDIKYLDIINESLPLMIASSLFFIMQWIDLFMLGILSDSNSVGIYNVVIKLSWVISIPLMAINSYTTPEIARLWSNKQLNKLQNFLWDGANLSILITIPILLFLIFFSEYILEIFGEVFKKGRIPILIICIGQLINASFGSVGALLQMSGNQQKFQNILLCFLLMNIVANSILIPLYGILGASISTTISLIGWNITSALYAKKKLGLSTLVNLSKLKIGRL